MKNIPKPIITIGYSTKKVTSGKLAFEIDGNKLKKMDLTQVGMVMAMLADLQTEVMKATNSKLMIGRFVLTPFQYEDIVNYITTEKYLHAVKSYKEFTGTGLKEAKAAIDALRFKLNKNKSR